MRSILLLITYFITPTLIFAQLLIEGRVTDPTGNPLEGTSVFIPEQNKGTVCDKSGEYRIGNLPAGKIKIQFSHLGYNTEFRTIIATSKLYQLNVSLYESVVETQEVVVTGGSVSSQHQNAVKIEVLKNKEIALSGTPNFMESLTTIPGVDMIAKGPGVSKPVIRGLSMNDILVMKNGVRIENYQFSENHPLGVDDNQLDRVEIIKGPASLLYGSDAIGGVINFISDKPAPTGNITGDYQILMHSNTLGMNNSLGIKGSSDKFYAGIRFNHKTHADYKQGGGAFVPNSRFNEWSLSSNAGYTGRRGTSTVYYDCYKQDLGMTVPPVSATITEQGRKNTIWYQDLEHHLVSSQNKISLGRFRWETNVAYQSALRKLHKTSSVPSVEMNLNTITYESELHLPSDERSEYIFGIQGMSQSNRNKHNRESQFLPDANINNVGILSLLQYTWFNKIRIQGGIRLDIYNTKTYALGTEGAENYHPPLVKKYSSLNGSVGATYTLNEKLLFRTNLAKAYRVPNLSELTSNGEHGNRWETGNENLKPENAYETDASMHYHGIFLSFDLAGFYNMIHNYIFISPTSDTTSTGMNIYVFSHAKAQLFGGEAGIHFHPKLIPWLDLTGLYSTVTGKQGNGDYLPFIPAQKFRYELRVGKEKIAFFKQSSLWISFISALKQNHPSLYETSTNGYTLVNAGIITGIKIKNQLMTIGLTINNVFDTRYYDHLSTLKALDFFNQGRNISLSLKLPFGIE